jgi:hypothetical protein
MRTLVLEYETPANALAAIGGLGSPPGISLRCSGCRCLAAVIGGRAMVSGHGNGLVAVVRFRR